MEKARFKRVTQPTAATFIFLQPEDEDATPTTLIVHSCTLLPIVLTQQHY